MIEVSHVTKSYMGIAALNDINISINKGSVFGLVGSNGAGKTTLMKLLAGIYRPDKGQVLVNSERVAENVDIKSRLVFIPDQLYFFPNYSILDMAEFYKSIYPHWNQERFLKLQEVFLMDRKRKIKTLSKGMQRQASFWLALALMPEILILDEPLDGLDPVMRGKVKNLIIQDVAEREMTVVISSHNLRELEDICDSIAIMHNGSILIQKDLDELKADIHKIQLAFTGESPETLELDEIEIIHQEKRGSVFLLIVRGNHQEIISALRSLKPAILDILPLTLEEIFIYEMGDNGYEVKSILF